MSTALETHLVNQAKLSSVASSLPPPSSSGSVPAAASAPLANPLLSRGKLKKAPPNKKKDSSKDRKKAASNTSTVISSGPTSNELREVVKDVQKDEQVALSRDDGNELASPDGHDDVLDLADQLLSQLDARDDLTSTPPLAPTPSVAATLSPSATPSAKTPAASSRATSVSSHASTTRERLHNLGDDVRQLLLPNSFAHIVHSSDGASTTSTAGGKEKGISRQKARKLRKEKEVDSIKRQAHDEVAHANDHSIEEERRAILAGCTKLGVRIKEISPDGHCLYSAIADQANVLRLSPHKETYHSTRKYAAAYMRSHVDEFLPFLESSEQEESLMTPEEYEKYCATVENTAEWGGEPEIKALAKHFNVQIHVLQAGTNVLKIGEDLPLGATGPMRISYHRKMYGLGEHYNSLVPATYAPPATFAMG